eukprot:Nitzschia sp. Nitz4//scaffold59_size112058//79431//83130//NITZ4_004120-RA/size112058-snap-gene-0.38-mRNA-1//1//CDS//3329555156//6068//frame0
MTTVNLITSTAGLLSGDLDECLDPSDESCSSGVAEMMAFARHYTQGEPTMIIQFFDKDSPFVNMHPLKWMLNRYILQEIFKLSVLVSPPSLLLQNKVDSSVSQRDISDLQSKDFPYLISNADLDPSNSWYQYTEAVHFDRNTKLAILHFDDSGVPLTSEHVPAARGLLNHIAKVNKENGCSTNLTDYQEYVIQNPIEVDLSLGNRNNNTQVDTTSGICWTPVVVYTDVEEEARAFLHEAAYFPNPPAFVTIQLISQVTEFIVPQLYANTTMWVAQCVLDTDAYCQHRLTMSGDLQPAVLDVNFISDDLSNLPSEYKDETYNETIWALRKLADEAEVNNPIVGYSEAMPIARIDNYRFCKGGECPVGRLFTEAIRWYTGTDVAFTSSGGYRGTGWEAGGVKLTDVYAGLPFPNTECTGTMSGVSLFKIMNYSMSVATFESSDTTNGGRLLQLAGMRVTYNTLVNVSRVVAIDIWNETSAAYEPIDRLSLYTFSTDSYVCGGYDPYPEMTVTDLVLDGEVPGVIGVNLIQNMVADYLGQLEEPYNTSYQGTLVNDTANFEILNLVQDASSCEANTAWNEDLQSCVQCPSFEYVSFSDEVLYFEADYGTEVVEGGRIILVNRETFDVSVLLKSQPPWLEFTNATHSTLTDIDPDLSVVPLDSGDSLALQFRLMTSSIGGGTSQSVQRTVSFGVEDGGDYPGCSGLDATFDVLLTVTPKENQNHLGGVFFYGVVLACIIGFTTVGLVSWVWYHRNTRVVKVMQPLFLVTTCVGVFILGLSIIPMGIDDGNASETGVDTACMAVPWLLSTGFALAFSALFSKLWRINRLFAATQGIQRIVVRQQDVLLPFAGLFALNLGVLLTWSLVDPLTWERFEINNESWHTYGQCVGDTVSTIMVSLLGAVNLAAFLMACIQAYLARNISDEFSESKYIGIAIYGWFQLLLVGVPILFLIGGDNPVATFVLKATLIFFICMSLMLILFMPAFSNLHKKNRVPGDSTISGMNTRSAGSVRSEPNSDSQANSVLSAMLPPPRKNVQLAVMDSIVESNDENRYNLVAEKVSASAERRLLDTEARERQKMIQQQLGQTSMAENVAHMLEAMQESDSDSDSSDDCVPVSRSGKFMANDAAGVLHPQEDQKVPSTSEVEAAMPVRIGLPFDSVAHMREDPEAVSDDEVDKVIQRRSKMIEDQLGATSMAENVEAMMRAMEDSDSDSDSD